MAILTTAYENKIFKDKTSTNTHIFLPCHLYLIEILITDCVVSLTKAYKLTASDVFLNSSELYIVDSSNLSSFKFKRTNCFCFFQES